MTASSGEANPSGRSQKGSATPHMAAIALDLSRPGENAPSEVEEAGGLLGRARRADRQPHPALKAGVCLPAQTSTRESRGTPKLPRLAKIHHTGHSAWKASENGRCQAVVTKAAFTFQDNDENTCSHAKVIFFGRLLVDIPRFACLIIALPASQRLLRSVGL